jgi:hypothetical protein
MVMVCSSYLQILRLSDESVDNAQQGDELHDNQSTQWLGK